MWMSLKESAMSGTTIKIAGNGNQSFTGYLALPSAGSGPGLILCQEIFGVNATIRELAEALVRKRKACVVN
jgi:carboxymethylenebutenolidase